MPLEAIPNYSMWVWNSFLGMLGCLNDIYVVKASPLAEKIAVWTYQPPCEYQIDCVRSHEPYRLCDLIYPKKPMLIGTILHSYCTSALLLCTLKKVVLINKFSVLNN